MTPPARIAAHPPTPTARQHPRPSLPPIPAARPPAGAPIDAGPGR